MQFYIPEVVAVEQVNVVRLDHLLIRYWVEKL